MDEKEWLASGDPNEMLAHLRRLRESKVLLVSDRKVRLWACACWRAIRLEAAASAETFGAAEIFSVAENAVDVAELFADGKAGERSLEACRHQAGGYRFAWAVAAKLTCWRPDCGGYEGDTAEACCGVADDAHKCGTLQAALLRDIVGNPFRPVLRKVRRKCRCGGDYVPCKKKSLPVAIALCTKCHAEGPWWPEVDEDRFAPWLSWRDGTVAKMAAAIYEQRTFGGLPVLADALEEAGCCEAQLLEHLRGWEAQPGGGWRRAFEEGGPHVRGCWVLDLLLGKS